MGHPQIPEEFYHPGWDDAELSLASRRWHDRQPLWRRPSHAADEGVERQDRQHRCWRKTGSY